MQKMGCVQRVIRFIFSPLRRNAKKPRSPKNTFSVSAQTEVSNSTACESKSSSKSVETSTEEDSPSCREESHRRVSRQHKKREHSESSLASESEQQSTSSAEDRKRGHTKKKKAKNILGESVIVEKPYKKEKGRGKHKEKHVDEPQASSSMVSESSGRDTSKDYVSRRSRADAQKNSKRYGQTNRKGVKKLGMRAVDSLSDTQTDYSFIIDNYIGSDAGIVEVRDAHRKKDYSILLKHRLCEYIESLDSHNNQNISFWG